jgi:CRISPR type III-A-associated RAMP protein Csm4
MLIQLQPTAPWRIGPDSGDRDRVDRIYHSDSLYSAVSSAMSRLGLLDEWLSATALADEPAVRFSSCFPFLGDTRFIVPPRSLWPPPASSKVRWRGAKFVPVKAVSELLASKTLSEEGWTVDPASECLVPMNAPGGPFRVAVRSSAAVDRSGAGVVAHSTACIEFAPGGGLWAAAEFSDDAARETWGAKVQGAIRLLADSGFGGERSRGWGRAEVSFSDDALPFASSSDGAGDSGWWMLSLFHPAANDEIDWKRGSYSLTTRGGRVESPASWGDAKKPTRMIAEGSVIVAATEPRGSAANVAPDDFAHPVYRAGFALAVAIPWKQTATPAGRPTA